MVAGKVGLGVARIRRDQPDLNFKPLFKDALGIVCKAVEPATHITESGEVAWVCCS